MDNNLLKRVAVPLAALLLTTACAGTGEYFGRVKQPGSRRLVWDNGLEPASLDPQLMLTSNEGNIAGALFDSLIRLDPITLQPSADIATHYERNPEATRYVFFLRGHPHPRGIKLPNTESLHQAFERGQTGEDLARAHKAPLDSIPARWSDGRLVTAYDVVYSWQRLFDPRTAAPFAHLLTYIVNSAEILAGRKTPDHLGVRAIDDWTLEVSLNSSTEFFLEVLNSYTMFVVPRQAIEAAEARGARDSWTDPGHIVTSGPFLLAEWDPYEKITLRKNQGYWEADLVALDEITFLPIADNLTKLNLYKANDADVIVGLPPAYVPILKGKKDYITIRTQGEVMVEFNTSKPPMDNVLLRYALNMATDKQEVANLFNGDQMPAHTFVEPTLGYTPPSSVLITIGNSTYDVSRYEPHAARDLIARAGYPGGLKQDGEPLRIGFIYTSYPAASQDLVELLRREWHDNLGIELETAQLESSVYWSTMTAGNYQGLALSGWSPGVEPIWFMDFFLSSEQAAGTFWKPAEFTDCVDKTKGVVGRAARLVELAKCDTVIMGAMPVIPLIFTWWDAMVKPYVKGIPPSPISDVQFKYAWVVTN